MFQVISSPFDDIVPRVRKPKVNEDVAQSKKADKKGTKSVVYLSNYIQCVVDRLKLLVF